MAPKGRGSSSASGSAGSASMDWDPLTKEELKFVWHGLVDEGKLSVPMLQKFMKEVCGVKLSRVQAKDLLNYMDADGNNAVGFADFEYFMSVGRLGDTDPKSFMWTPKANWRREHPDKAPLMDEELRDPMQDSSIKATAGLLSGSGARGSVSAPDKSKGVDEATRQKIERSLESYEQMMWQKFLKQEEELPRKLFEQWSHGHEELSAMEFHKMLQKWYPLAQPWAPGDLRASDSLATLEYFLRRQRSKEGKDPETHVDAKLAYELWLDVVSGKCRPDEHVMEDKRRAATQP